MRFSAFILGLFITACVPAQFAQADQVKGCEYGNPHKTDKYCIDPSGQCPRGTPSLGIGGPGSSSGSQVTRGGGKAEMQRMTIFCCLVKNPETQKLDCPQSADDCANDTCAMAEVK